MRRSLNSAVLCIGFLAFLSDSIYADEVLKPAPPEASSPREDLRKQIFGKKQHVDTRACETLATDPAATVAVDSGLQDTVREIIKAMNNSDEKTLRDDFNPRLKIKAGQVAGSLMKLKKIIGSKYAVTNYRVVALNSPDGSTGPIECEDTGVLMHPLYGYPLSAGVWLQATGEEEVARIFIALVPSKKDWTIGAFHIQQWTHAGKDFAMWYETAQGFALKNHKTSAYIAADIAAKLLDGGGFLVFPVKQEAEAWRDKQMSHEAWVKAIHATFPQDELVHVATLFVRGGAGVLLRFGIKAEISANAVREDCKVHLQKAMAAEWGEAIQGIRCGYNFPRENAKSEGVMGSIYISKDDLKDKV